MIKLGRSQVIMGSYESSKEEPGLERVVRIGGCQWDIMRVARSQDWRGD